MSYVNFTLCVDSADDHAADKTDCGTHDAPCLTLSSSNEGKKANSGIGMFSGQTLDKTMTFASNGVTVVMIEILSLSSH